MTTSKTSETRDTLVRDIDKLKHSAERVAHDVRDHATAHVEETKQHVTNTLQSLRENLASHPFSLLGIGFAVGLLFGLRLRG